MSGYDFTVRTKQDMVDAVQAFGFLPFFAGPVRGFSLEEHAAADVWYSDAGWKVWDWKGPVIRESGCAYGKFFGNKAVFVSAEWFPDLANWRRDGYDFDARYDDGLATRREKDLYDLLAASAPVTSRTLKAAGNYLRGGRKGFDTTIARLQAQGYVIISDFVYAADRHGRPYGWGIAEYSTPEIFFGEGFAERAYRRSPEESFRRILDHVLGLFPDAEEETVRRYLR